MLKTINKNKKTESPFGNPVFSEKSKPLFKNIANQRNHRADGGKRPRVSREAPDDHLVSHAVEKLQNTRCHNGQGEEQNGDEQLTLCKIRFLSGLRQEKSPLFG